jgi:hypothetical protein
MSRNKKILLLTLKLAEAQRRQQKAQAFVDYLVRELLRHIGRTEKCDTENMLNMRECYEKGLLPGAKTFEEMVDEMYKN